MSQNKAKAPIDHRRGQGRRNADRAAATRAALLKAARTLFVKHGYADTATPDIVKAAGMTRGALYHHFADKKAVFAAVIEAESAAVAAEIDRSSQEAKDAHAALRQGSLAYFAAMKKPGRCRLLLLDGAAILGQQTMDEIDNRHAGRTLLEGLMAARADGQLADLDPKILAPILSGAFDRAALMLQDGCSKKKVVAVFDHLFQAVCKA